MSVLQHSFGKKEHLCLTKQIDYLFEHGRWLRSSTFRLVYRESEIPLNVPVQVMFSVPKKIHRKAVTRNLLKRRMRESYRKNKPDLQSTTSSYTNGLLLGFVYSAPEIEAYQNIEKEIKQLLSQLQARISKE